MWPRAVWAMGNDNSGRGHLFHEFERLVRKVFTYKLEPPIGIEPMTYALRGGLEPSSHVHQVTPALLTALLSPLASKVIQDCC